MKTKIIDSIIVMALAFAILYIFLGDQLIHPDRYVYAFGGDAAIIYFNMIFHAWYGEGWTLTNMNYPVYESILMTDAQASLAYLLNQVNRIDFFRENIIGVTHGFHYACLMIACVFSYSTLRKLGVDRWMAIAFGILIVFLSPQILRLRAGHFGLAYPIVFTSVIYGLVSFKLSGKWKYAFLIFITLLFFGINNIYLLILGAGLVVLSVVLDFVGRMFLQHKKKQSSVLSLLPFTVLPVLIVFVILKLTAPDMDRIDIQWGYFANRVKLKGLLYPYTSLIGTLLGKTKTNIEAVTNLGLVNSIFLIGLLFSFTVKRSRDYIRLFFKEIPMLSSMLWASIILLIYGMGTFKFLAELIPAATMFKASGRFAWPFFYVISFASIAFISKALKTLALSQKRSIYYTVIGISILVWTVESYTYLDKHVWTKIYENHYSYSKLSQIADDLKAENINVHDYQGIYALPVMVSWNDKYHTEAPWSTEYNSTRISMATGLPMINAKLSRIGLTRSNHLVQFASHPLIEKELLNSLDDRPILIVVGRKHELKVGEQYLIDQSILLKKYKGYELYHLEPSQLKLQSPPPCKENSVSVYRNGFDENDTADSFYGPGSWEVKGEEKIMDSATSFLTDSLYELSLYVKTDNHKYGMPWIRLIQYADQEVIKEQIYDVATSIDIDGMWRRGALEFSKADRVNRMEVHLFNINQNFLIDELQVRAISDSVCIKIPEETDGYLFNNYLID